MAEKIQQFEQTQLDIQPTVPKEMEVMSFSRLFGKIWNIGLITYGGPMSHIGVFRKIFIDDLECISSQKFTELLTLCQSLPGPTSTQLLIAISMYSTRSWFGGLISFLIFSFPTYLIMTLSALLLLRADDMTMVQKFLAGFRIVSVAIILQAFWNLSARFRERSGTTFLFLLSALIYYYYQSSLTILILFLAGGIFNLIYSKQNPSEEPDLSNRFQSCFYGWKNLGIFVIGLIMTYFIISQNPFSVIFATFYRIGSLVIGGGHVILPLMYTELSSYNYFTQQQYWNGFSIISCMPGPMFNLSVYMGTISAKSIVGGLCAFCGLYLPCFLFVSFALPVWEKYRNVHYIRKFITGVCCVSVGLILCTCLILYQTATHHQSFPFYYGLIILVCFALLHDGVSIVRVLVIGECLYLIVEAFIYLPS